MFLFNKLKNTYTDVPNSQNIEINYHITATDIHGNNHHLFDYLDNGKFVVLDFFFTTCGPCISSVPIINNAFTMFGCNTGDVIFLSIDNGDTDAEVLQYEIDYSALPPAASGNDGGGNVVNNTYATLYNINLFGLDLSISKHVLMLWIVAFFTITISLYGTRIYRKNISASPKGISHLFEILIEFKVPLLLFNSTEFVSF